MGEEPCEKLLAPRHRAAPGHARAAASLLLRQLPTFPLPLRQTRSLALTLARAPPARLRALVLLLLPPSSNHPASQTRRRSARWPHVRCCSFARPCTAASPLTTTGTHGPCSTRSLGCDDDPREDASLGSERDMEPNAGVVEPKAGLAGAASRRPMSLPLARVSDKVPRTARGGCGHCLVRACCCERRCDARVSPQQCGCGGHSCALRPVERSLATL